MSQDENVRAAFVEVALGLMEWCDPPAWEPKVYRCWDPPSSSSRDGELFLGTRRHDGIQGAQDA